MNTVRGTCMRHVAHAHISCLSHHSSHAACLRFSWPAGVLVCVKLPGAAPADQTGICLLYGSTHARAAKHLQACRQMISAPSVSMHGLLNCMLMHCTPAQGGFVTLRCTGCMWSPTCKLKSDAFRRLRSRWNMCRRSYRPSTPKHRHMTTGACSIEVACNCIVRLGSKCNFNRIRADFA